MADKDSVKRIVKQILANGAFGVSVGLATIPVASATGEVAKNESVEPSFLARLGTVREAVTEHYNVAQVLPHPPPPPHPFLSNFGKWGNTK